MSTTPTTIALKWLLTRPGVTSVIIGVRRPEQLNANLAAVSLAISDDDLAPLTAMTQPPALYPNWMIERQSANRKV